MRHRGEVKETIIETHQYIYAGGKLLRETISDGTTTKTLDFNYDNVGIPYSLIYNDGSSTKTYYYITNLQGDVMYLVNFSGNEVAAYDYDPYGKEVHNMFTLIRIASALLLFVLCYFLLKALNVKGKKIVLISLISSVLLVGVMACFPPENLLVHFDTPKSAFRYTNTEEVVGVLYGKNSCDIIYKKSDNTYSDRIILQKGDSFQLPTILTEKLVSRKVGVSRSGSFDVYRVNGTQDYYVFATLPDIVADHSELYVIHRSGQAFQSDEGHLVKINGTHFICFYLPGPPEEYRLVVNGQEVIIAE